MRILGDELNLTDMDPSKFMPNYSSFLIDKLNKIENAWDEGDLELALKRACRLVFFLPKELKKQLSSKRDEISKEMNSVYGLTGVDFYTTHLVRNRQANGIALRHLPKFVDEIVDWLDERGFLEERRRKIPEGHE